MHAVVIFVVCFGTVNTVGNRDSKDYCENEFFTAHCSYNEVIVMETALYGRMELGRCVKVDMGYIGCRSNVIDIAHEKCSGRTNCEIGIPDAMLEQTRPCLELKSYLQASYSCLKVLTVDSSECRKSKFLRAYPPSGRIASISVQDTWCGTHDTPWLIQGAPGTRINISMMDFNAHTTGRSTALAHPITGEKSTGDVVAPILPALPPVVGDDVCHKYATIVEPPTVTAAERSFVVCGRRTRWQQLFVSDDHVVQIQLEPRRASSYYFVLSYEVFGCPNPTLPENSLLKRNKNEALIECKLTSESWKLVCNVNEWIGEIGNCTELAAYEILRQSTTAEKSSGGLVLIVLCVCTFLVSLVVVLLAVVMYKRYRHRRHLLAEREHPLEVVNKLDDFDLSYVRPSKGYHTYGRHKSRTRGSGSHGEAGVLESEGSGGEDNCSTKYEKVGSFNVNTGKYTHIWEMPLPIPGEG